MQLSHVENFLFMSVDCNSNRIPVCHFEKNPCYYENQRYNHGDYLPGVGKCDDGKVLKNCLVEGRFISHGDKIRMRDQVERQCDNAVIKPIECKTFG